MEIALCDDKKTHLEEMKRVFRELNSSDMLECFSDIKAFIKSVEDGVKYDIVLMDIDWENHQNGIDYAEYLYKASPKTSIIFVTGYSQQYIESVFMKKTNICGYLEKPIKSETLKCILDKINQDKIDKKQETILFKQRGKVISVTYDEICYIESEKHNIIIHTVEKNISLYEKLQNVVEMLPGKFFQCHKSFVVNFDYVKGIGKSVSIQSDTFKIDIPVSKQRKKQMEEAFEKYLEDDK